MKVTAAILHSLPNFHLQCIFKIVQFLCYLPLQQDVLTLHEKLQTKRNLQSEEREKNAAEEKRIQFEQQQQAAGAARVEQQKFYELRSGAKRELVVRQEDRLQATVIRDGLKRQEDAIRKRNTRKECKVKKDFLRSVSSYTVRPQVHYHCVIAVGIVPNSKTENHPDLQ